MSAATMASVRGILIVKVVPRPCLRADLDRAADELDIGLHDVHADAAARNGRHLLRGREARMEDELGDLRLAHALHLGLAREALLDRLAADGAVVEPAPVVGDLDRDRAALVIGVEADVPRSGLPTATRSAGASMP